MTAQFRTAMSIDAFFAHVDAHPDTRFDSMDGELVEILPTVYRGYLQAKIAFQLSIWTQAHSGIVHASALHVLNGDMFLPTVSVNAHTAHDQSHFDTPPLLAVEIRSDTQSRAAQRRKTERYRAHGTPAVLLVLPGDGIELFTLDSADQPQTFAPALFDG